ncbi:hypothetical protein [Thiomonas sp. FB-6]|uniref:hypothetical protein n=1 Tax=Thiomonas sp. FB-6 TaxID=1158291 RepID=UPI00037E6848|nr:hypothetical protein [Thiomonas sp. FB-6]
MSSRITVLGATVLCLATLAQGAHAASCTPVAAYRDRYAQGLLAYKAARAALIREIHLAGSMNAAPSSKGYARWNSADAESASAEDAYTKVVRLQGSYADALKCHSAADAVALQPYLYALTNLEIAGNLLFQARGDMLTTCNSALGPYTPYILAADQAVAMAKKAAAGGVKSRFPSDNIAQEPDELANMRDIPNRCGG